VAKLGDIQASGWNYENDELRVLNPATSANSKVLVWLTAEEAIGGGVGDKAGWYDATEFTFESGLDFDLGTGFLTSLYSSGVSFTYSGAVYDQAFTVPCTGKKYVAIPNAVPRQITLAEITATGWNYENDELRKLKKQDSSNEKVYVWLTAEEAIGGGVGDKAGWYDATEFTYEGATTVAPGEGFLTSLYSSSVQLNFPSATAAE